MTKVLVVDDNARTRKAVFKLLQYEGYTAVEATDGADGLRVAELDRPQLGAILQQTAGILRKNIAGS